VSSDSASSSAATVRQRRRSRQLAFQTLYEVDISAHRPAEVLERLTNELHLDPIVVEYADALVTGVGHNHQQLDDLIGRYAPAWPVRQMSAVDRNLLRLGIFEAIYNSTTIPVGVAINEAVELAKLYGSESSARFVNGVLGRVVAEHAQNHLPPDHL
jgi:N utilization substance protein B